MKPILRHAAFILLALSVASFAWAQEKPQGVQLSGAEVAQLLEPAALFDGHDLVQMGQFTSGFTRGGIAYQLYLAEGFNSIVQLKGTWRIDGKLLCVYFALAYPPGERCEALYKVSDGSYETWSASGDKRLGTFQVRKSGLAAH
jgi:hypothetical protein